MLFQKMIIETNEVKENNITKEEVTINDDGTLTYTPGEDFNGEDSFYYVVTDGKKDFANAKVVISDTLLALNGNTAQIAYVAYYGRPADKGGVDFWNNALTENNVSYAPRAGDRLTGNEKVIYDKIVNQFGTSAEADRFFGDKESNRDKVNQVYKSAFSRDGDVGGLDFWTDQLDKDNVTLATFALEVALGAQNEDIAVLNNKIESANLFSNSLDIPEEVNAYSGSTAEKFGRGWLKGFSDTETISSQSLVDAGLQSLVSGDFEQL